LAGANVAGELGRTSRALEQDQTRRCGKDGGRRPPLQFYGLAAFRTCLRRVEYAHSTARASLRKEDPALGADARTRCHGKVAAWAGEGQGKATGWTDIVFVVPTIIVKRLTTSWAKDLAAS
jgi:hypothetical protein